MKKVDVNNIAPAEVQELYLLHRKMVEKYGFLHYFRNADEYKNLFLSAFTQGEDELYIIENGGIVTFKKSADWGGNEQYELAVRLTEPTTDQLLTENLRKFIDGKLARRNKIAIVALNDELDKLIAEYPHKTQLKAGNYTLHKADINVSLLAETAAQCQAQNSDLRVVYSNALPETYIEPYCDLFNALQNDMPDVKNDGFVQYVEHPEKLRNRLKAFANNNRTHHCYMVFNANDEMIAMTNVAVNNNDPRFPYQFLIGVKDGYRGRGIGKWLYALMYKKLANSVDFEKTHVNHHSNNKHAIDISEWVGYKFGYIETTFIIG